MEAVRIACMVCPTTVQDPARLDVVYAAVQITISSWCLNHGVFFFAISNRCFRCLNHKDAPVLGAGLAFSILVLLADLQLQCTRHNSKPE